MFCTLHVLQCLQIVPVVFVSKKHVCFTDLTHAVQAWGGPAKCSCFRRQPHERETERTSTRRKTSFGSRRNGFNASAHSENLLEYIFIYTNAHVEVMQVSGFGLQLLVSEQSALLSQHTAATFTKVRRRQQDPSPTHALPNPPGSQTARSDGKRPHVRHERHVRAARSRHDSYSTHPFRIRRRNTPLVTRYSMVKDVCAGDTCLRHCCTCH